MSKKLKERTLQSAIAAVDDGVWVDVTAWSRISVHVIPTNVSTSQIFGACTPTIPANNVDHAQLGSDISANEIYEVSAKIKYIKVKVSAWTSGTVTAYAIGDETAYGL